jgi:hypothetical protein
MISENNQTGPLDKTTVSGSFSSEEDYDMYLMDLAYAPMIEYEAKRQIKHENMFKVIKKLRGKAFVKDLKYLNEYNDSNCEFYISNKPLGKPQKETDCRIIKEIYVEQWNTGMESDSYAGNVSVEIRKGQFIVMPFSC